MNLPVQPCGSRFVIFFISTVSSKGCRLLNDHYISFKRYQAVLDNNGLLNFVEVIKISV